MSEPRERERELAVMSFFRGIFRSECCWVMGMSRLRLDALLVWSHAMGPLRSRSFMDNCCGSFCTCVRARDREGDCDYFTENFVKLCSTSRAVAFFRLCAGIL